MPGHPVEEPTDITLRKVDEADTEFLYDLYRSVCTPALVAAGWNEQQISDFVTIQYHASTSGYKARFPEADHDIIMRGDKKVGQILVSRACELTTLVDISLLPEARNLGVGTCLIRDLIRETSTTGIPVRLSVAVGNPARRLYERLGFTSLNNDGVHEQMEWRPGR